MSDWTGVTINNHDGLKVIVPDGDPTPDSDLTLEDAIRQLDAAVKALQDAPAPSGGSAPDSWLRVVLGASSADDVVTTGWDVATFTGAVSSEGSDVTLDVDQQTFQVHADGLYALSVEVYASVAVDDTVRRIAGVGLQSLHGAPDPGYFGSFSQGSEFAVPQGSGRMFSVVTFAPARLLSGTEFKLAWDASPGDGSITVEHFSAAYLVRLS